MDTTPSTARLERVTLTGEIVELVPLDEHHIPGLIEAYPPGAMDLMSRSADCEEPLEPDAAASYVAEALEGWADGRYLPFVVTERSSGRVLGATRFGDIAMDVPRMEIGWTWYALDARGTVVNPESKLLLLTHAFETLGCEVVTLRTSEYNVVSKAAIAKLGATRDGVLRRHVHQRDGRLRDTVVFSILSDDWPRIRTQLTERVATQAAEWT
ncbi:MAG: GCN5-related N-acetyltransferase [Thermoleophilia bacterium]|nr:GCN5-related N-acetyltransferase [Thermoleophilia bacterium]